MSGKEEIVSENWLGSLPQNDPLYDFLKNDVQPNAGIYCDNPVYDVFKLHGSNSVYLYTERFSGQKIVGKFFLPEGSNDYDTATERMEKEYNALTFMRSYGFDTPPFYVAKPLGKNIFLNDFLAVEFCEGELFSRLITQAIYEKNDAFLFDSLRRLARFFAAFHNRTAQDKKVDFNKTCLYMDKLVRQCTLLLSSDETLSLYHLKDRWRSRDDMWSDGNVKVHGDATPDNFMLDFYGNVITFDMERFMSADRMFDIGRMAGELKHFFLKLTNDRFSCEPFIGHFLWEYASCFPDRQETFDALSRRLPFYMGINLLRIARNWWLDQPSRHRLVDEAFSCLYGVDE